MPLSALFAMLHALCAMLSVIASCLTPCTFVFIYRNQRSYVPHDCVKSALGALAKGRKAKESGDSYQLREPSAPYGEHFGVKNEDIGLKNTYFWNFNPE